MKDIEIKEYFEQYIQKINIPYYSLFFIDELSATHIYANLPETWIQDFLSLKMDINSDIIIKSHKKLTPFIWTDKDLSNNKLKHLALKYNIKSGATFIVKLGTITILFTIYPSDTPELFSKFFDSQKSKIQFDLLNYFEHFYRTNTKITFTLREKEVINLLKIGKTYDEISLILNIKERTVRFHANNITNKLNTSSIKYAIYKATKMGLI
ncbi:helix-turn-helix transcriptional regulator [Vibrio salinus]|uniref:helix-turn-helix transcriptional regulator n=1 Tax=Vibrio salinus TaxID=2899784 RepID=UPI001E33FA92|nr:LuxR family transcriptional regulator [Vibrio salinus]MCE0495615.1 LuxR family transcriptional regulator [Vibrio salinus]